MMNPVNPGPRANSTDTTLQQFNYIIIPTLQPIVVLCIVNSVMVVMVACFQERSFTLGG